MKIYIGNLSLKLTEWRVRNLFARFGKVGDITMNNKAPETAGYHFCFVEMPFDNQATRAIRELDGTTIDGNIMSIKESGLR